MPLFNAFCDTGNILKVAEGILVEMSILLWEIIEIIVPTAETLWLVIFIETIF